LALPPLPEHGLCGFLKPDLVEEPNVGQG
jgi:hypothetical protein